MDTVLMVHEETLVALVSWCMHQQIPYALELFSQELISALCLSD